ncbi:peptidase inhibitor family I36 protein [Streptomyces platensis]|uniref:peptidase inhibitor family I36 protein n=1 Tax=Streptomyces platensis TaxID=58346 RepID=UPI003870E8CA|nr:peptidase inhibitor family I36 protein [Streptomyces platensis]
MEAKNSETYIIEGRGEGDCPDGYVCLYEGNGFNVGGTAQILVTKRDIPDARDFQFNDRASSFVNKNGHSVVFYREVHYEGGSDTVSPGSSAGEMPSRVGNDSLSSLKFVP